MIDLIQKWREKSRESYSDFRQTRIVLLYFKMTFNEVIQKLETYLQLTAAFNTDLALFMGWRDDVVLILYVPKQRMYMC